MNVFIVYKSLFDDEHKSSNISHDDYDCITLFYSQTVSRETRIDKISLTFNRCIQTVNIISGL